MRKQCSAFYVKSVRKKYTQNVIQFPDENTRSKFLFYGGPDCLNINDGLEYYIDSGIIPDFLGGPCPVSKFIYHILDTFMNTRVLVINERLYIIKMNEKMLIF